MSHSRRCVSATSYCNHIHNVSICTMLKWCHQWPYVTDVYKTQGHVQTSLGHSRSVTPRCHAAVEVGSHGHTWDASPFLR